MDPSMSTPTIPQVDAAQIASGFSTGILITLGVLVIAGALLGWARGWKRSLLYLGFLALSLVLSVVAVTTLGADVTEAVRPVITDAIENNMQNIQDLTQQMEGAAQYVTDIAFAMIKPVMFVLCFLAFSLVMLIPYGILSLIFFPKHRRDEDGNRVSTRTKLDLIGLGVGAVAGVLVTVCLLMPVAGTINTVGAVDQAVAESDALLAEGQEADAEPADSLASLLGKDGSASLRQALSDVSAAGDNFVLKLAGGLGGNALYNALTEMEAPDGTKTSVTGELRSLVHLLPGCGELLDRLKSSEEVGGGTADTDSSGTGTQSSKKLDLDMTEAKRLLLPVLQDSPYIATFVTELLNTAGTKWNNGETFLSIDLKKMSQDYATYQAVVQKVIDAMMQTKVATVSRDFGNLLDCFTLLSNAQNYMVMFDEDETDVTKEDMVKQLDKVLKNITPDNVDIFQEMLSTEVIKTADLKENDAETVSAIVRQAVNKIAQIPAEDREKEAEAVNNLISYASDINDDKKTVDSEEMVDAVLASSVICTSITEYAEDNKATGIEIPDDRKQELADVLAAKEAGATEEQLATIAAVRALFGLNDLTEDA